MTQTLASAFLAGCGAGGPLTLEVSGPSGPPQLHTFRTPSVLVGTHQRSDLRLEGERVSRRHAYLQVIGGRVFCLDLASRTGVSWPDGIRTRGWLEPGRPIRVGPHQLTLAGTPAGGGAGNGAATVSDPLEDRVEGSARMPRVLVEISDGAAGKDRWRMTRLVGIVGRWAGAKVRLRDPSVSRFHCALVRTPAGVWAVDLLSRTGTHRNGRAIRWEAVRDGDRLRVGRFVLRFWYEGAVPAFPGEGAAPETARDLPLPEPPPALPPAFPVIPAAPEGADGSLLLPVMEQFKVMHQNMFDQFQQTLLLLVQMFTTMHQDQAGLVRQELEAYHQATQELRSLQEQLRRHEPAGAREAAHPARDLPGAGPSPGKGAVPAPRVEGPAPARGKAARANAGGAAERDEPMPDEQTPEVHAWLSKRIADLQQERQGRWQRILGFVLGK